MNYFWVIVEKFGSVLLKMIGMVLLARTLTPEDFGVYGMVFVLIALSNVLIDGGLGGSLIKKKNPNSIDYRTVFTFNLLVSFSISLCLFFSSNIIADFYSEKVLVDIIPFLSLLIIVKSLTIIPLTQLTKELKFKEQTTIYLVSYIVALIVALYLAKQGKGVFTLVYMSIIETFFLCVFSYSISRYIPKIGFSIHSFKELYPFGVKLSMASIIRTLYDNILYVIFGRYLGANSLGFYYQANKVNEIFIRTIKSVVDKATFPILIMHIDNKIAMHEKMKKTLGMTCCLSFILCSLIVINSDEIIFILFGDGWAKSAWYLKIISFAGYGMIIEAVTRSFIKSFGFAGTILRLEVIKCTLGIIIIIGAISYKIDYALIAFVVSTLLAALLNMIAVHSKTNYKFIEQLFDIGKPLFYSILLMLFHYFFDFSYEMTSISRLFIWSAIPISIYFAAMVYHNVIDLSTFK
ncbi:lipopolysaccharide biosynthesis protein [Providencia rettgeri]